MRVRRWPDFLSLGVTEIREYGGSSIQVVRRLRALLLELSELVLPEHRAAVERSCAASTPRSRRTSRAASTSIERASRMRRESAVPPGPNDT